MPLHENKNIQFEDPERRQETLNPVSSISLIKPFNVILSPISQILILPYWLDLGTEGGLGSEAFLFLKEVIAGLPVGRGKDEGRAGSQLMKEAGLSPLPRAVSPSNPQGSRNQANRACPGSALHQGGLPTPQSPGLVTTKLSGC